MNCGHNISCNLYYPILVDLELLQKILSTPFLVIKIHVQRGSQAHHQMHYQQVIGKRMGRLITFLNMPLSEKKQNTNMNQKLQTTSIIQKAV